ncbi:MAG: hypothetical protein GY930_10840 [bacterium]|nr:hypothetical protein [bacterium]
MKRNPERLERILRIRRLQEETARGVWLQAELAAREADERVVHCHDNIAMGHDHVREQQAAGSIDGVLQSDAAMHHLHNALAQTRIQASARHRDVETTKAPWLETRKAARGMQKLVERAKADQHTERQKKEDQALEASIESLLLRQKDRKHSTPST